MHSPVQKDLLSHVGHPKEMRRGNVWMAATIVKITHGRTIRGVPQLNDEGTHNACIYLRKTVSSGLAWSGACGRRETAQQTCWLGQSSCRTPYPPSIGRPARSQRFTREAAEMTPGL
ncbi:MAG: hypothetical protein E6645_30785, partial [Bradyrhizobium sp.]|nr:hypothetical protein [Bradyrhizobium sp.]